MDDTQKELRKCILRLSHKCMDGNLQSAFSCIDAIWVLYDKVMNWSPANAESDDRDIFLVSKGQATLALYAVLIRKGYFSEADLDDIGQFGSRFSNQVDATKFAGGIENSAGSLGHGFPMACGMAMANKIRGLPGRVFVVAGDGEFNEGTMWESCIVAAGRKLDNLCVIVDDNDSVGAMVDMGDLGKKLECFGFEVRDANGHDAAALEGALRPLPRGGRPLAVIAHTERGHGSSTLMGDSIWFHKAPNAQEVDVLSKEIDLS